MTGPGWPARTASRAVAVTHWGFLGYLLGGGVLAWRHPRSAPLHAAAVGWAVVVVTTPWPCPLTTAQNALRRRGGLDALPGTFLDSVVAGRCYPRSQERAAQLATAGIVLASWARLLARRRRDCAAAR